MLPPAPARLSTTMLCPSAAPIPGAMMRAVMSMLPPGEYGTMRRIGRVGKFCAAAPDTARKAIASAAVARRILLRRRMCGLSAAHLVLNVRQPLGFPELLQQLAR